MKSREELEADVARLEQEYKDAEVREDEARLAHSADGLSDDEWRAASLALADARCAKIEVEKRLRVALNRVAFERDIARRTNPKR